MRDGGHFLLREGGIKQRRVVLHETGCQQSTWGSFTTACLTPTRVMYTKAGIQSLGLQTYNFNLSNWNLHTLGLSVRGELATCASQESQSKWCISTSRIQATYTRDVQHRCFEWFLGLIIFTGIHIHVFNDFDHDVENIENPILGLVFDHVQLPGIHLNGQINEVFPPVWL